MPTDIFSVACSNAVALARRLDAPALDDELPAILRAVQGFCAKYVDSARIDRDEHLGAELLGRVAEQGWFGLSVSPEYGGAGLSMAAVARVISELARFDGSLGTCVGLHSGLAMHAMLHLASPDLRRRYLPEIAAGCRVAAFAATEPGAGSDISAVRTTLRESDGKLLLSGSKIYVTNGAICGLVTVLARSPGLGGAKAGHTLVAVDPTWRGVQRGVEERKLGLKGSSTITIDFDEVVIPADHVLGVASQGLAYAHNALAWGRTFLAAGCLGVTKAALEATRAHVAHRHQFGRPLAGFVLVRNALAHAQAEIYAIESVLRLVCAYQDMGAGEPGGSPKTQLVQELGVASTALKILASEGAWNHIDRGIQIFGGAGFLEDVGMARRLRDVRVTRIFEGANDVLRLHLAFAALAWPLANLRNVNLRAVVSPFFLKQAIAIERTLIELADMLEHVRKTWGFRVYEQQTIQWHIADSVVALFAATASLLRADSVSEANPGNSETTSATPQLAVDIQLRRATEAIGRAGQPLDVSHERLLELVSKDCGETI